MSWPFAFSTFFSFLKNKYDFFIHRVSFYFIANGFINIYTYEKNNTQRTFFFSEEGC